MNYKVIDPEQYYRRGVFRHFTEVCKCSTSVTARVDVTDLVWESRELICYDRINPTHYVFHEDTETCTPVYTEYTEDYGLFYRNALGDIEKAKRTREYGLDAAGHPNWFDASYISWLSYDSLNIELPDGYLYFAPIVNWGRYREENGRLMMPVTVRLNHAVADGYLVANVFRLLEREIRAFCRPGADP